jgi:hypothetical protein
MSRALYAYPWDFPAASAAADLAAVGAMGIDSITLAAAYHAGKFIRPRAAVGKVIFPEDGTVYFRARAERYGALKPQVSQLTRDDDVLGRLCAAPDLAVNAWLVLLHNTRLGTAHPEATVRNAYGDSYVYSLCPANPEVRTFAVALVADVSEAYPIAGVSLETPGYLPYGHGFHHEFAQVEANRWLDGLLALCFCPHCVSGAKTAGIEAEALRLRVAAAIDGYLASEVSAPQDMAVDWWTGDLLADPDLAAFLRWRCDVVTNLVREIRDAVRAEVTVAVIPSVQRPSSLAWLEGSDLYALARAADVLEVPFYEPDAGRIRADAWDVKRRIGEDRPLRAILRPGWPDMASRDDLVAALAALRDAGIEDVGFYNYGLLRPMNLKWLAETPALNGGES